MGFGVENKNFFFFFLRNCDILRSMQQFILQRWTNKHDEIQTDPTSGDYESVCTKAMLPKNNGQHTILWILHSSLFLRSSNEHPSHIKYTPSRKPTNAPAFDQRVRRITKQSVAHWVCNWSSVLHGSSSSLSSFWIVETFPASSVDENRWEKRKIVAVTSKSSRFR